MTLQVNSSSAAHAVAQMPAQLEVSGSMIAQYFLHYITAGTAQFPCKHLPSMRLTARLLTDLPLDLSDGWMDGSTTMIEILRAYIRRCRRLDLKGVSFKSALLSFRVSEA